MIHPPNQSPLKTKQIHKQSSTEKEESSLLPVQIPYHFPPKYGTCFDWTRPDARQLGIGAPSSRTSVSLQPPSRQEQVCALPSPRRTTPQPQTPTGALQQSRLKHSTGDLYSFPALWVLKEALHETAVWVRFCHVGCFVIVV